MDLQLFNREADQIDAATSSHETFLDYKDLGVSVMSQLFRDCDDHHISLSHITFLDS